MSDNKQNKRIAVSPDPDKRSASRPVLNAVSTRSRITEDLRTRIITGEFGAGILLPSRRDMAQEYGVAIGTMQSAITDLIADGLLVVRDRMGTFVAETIAPTSVQPIAVEASPAYFGLILQQESGWPNIIARALEQEVTRQSGRTLSVNTKRLHDNTSLASAVRSLQEGGANGIAIILPESDDPFADIAHVVDEQTPPCVCIVSQPVPSPRVSSVYYDSREAGYQAAQHLLEQGCRELLFFAPCLAHWVLERSNGARQALRHAGLSEDAFQVHIAPISYSQFHEEGREYEEASFLEAQQHLSQHGPPCGVIAANDAIALGFWRAAEERGLQPGKDFILIGFDDHSISRERGLTSLGPPLEALGIEAARLLLQHQRGQTETTLVCLRSCLVARASTYLHRIVKPSSSSE